MKHLFNLLLILMSGTMAIECIAAESTDQLFISVVGLTLSLCCMIINIISPLFKN